MKLATAFSSGLIRTKHSIKPIIIIWIINLLSISLVAGPIRRLILTAVGNSNATQMISDGFRVDFWADLPVALPALSSLTSGVFLLFAILFFVNVFLNGGLFDSLRANTCRYMTGNFFKASAKLFFAYILVTILVMLMIIVLLGLIIGVPIALARASESGGLPLIVKIIRIIFILFLPLFFLVVDYARVWLAANGPDKVFKALGYGFKATFSAFLSSYIFMIVMIAIQAGFVFLASKLLDFSPQTGGGLFLLFLLSQALMLIRLALRVWRYGGVTAMYMM